LDAWHGTLIGAITTLTGAVVALWKHANSLRKSHSKELAELHEKHDQEKDALHNEHKDDIRVLTQASLELGLSVLARTRPLIGSSPSRPLSDEPEE
jgi:hypothetical protein